jgi:hypothetical protein
MKGGRANNCVYGPAPRSNKDLVILRVKPADSCLPLRTCELSLDDPRYITRLSENEIERLLRYGVRGAYRIAPKFGVGLAAHCQSCERGSCN